MRTHNPPENRSSGAFNPRSIVRRMRSKRSTVISLCTVSLLLLVAIGALVTTSKLVKAAAAANTAVTTYKGDNARTGTFPNETTLNTSNVNQTQFGKRVTYPVDGYVYAEPLYMPNITIGGVSHNVVFVATEHDSLYAFDADQSTTVPALWHTSFLSAGVTSVSTADVSCNDMVPEIGITGTPVIDTNTNTMYVVVFTKESTGLVYRLHAIDISTGLDKPGGSIVLQASVPGTGSNYEAVNGQVTFKPLKERQRTALIQANGQIYIAFGSFCDDGPYHGWILSYAYNNSAMQQMYVYNSTANGAGAGFWGGGGGVTADSSGNIYASTANGDFDLNNAGGTEAGDSFIKLSPQLQLLDYFSPFNQSCLKLKDTDIGSGGPVIINSLNEGIGGGKEGRLYVMNNNNMGKFTTDPTLNCNTTERNRTDIDKVLQETPPSTIGGIYSTPAYWNGPNGPMLYIASAGSTAKAYSLTNGLLSANPTSQSAANFGFTGGNPVVSSNGSASGTGIMWTIDPNVVIRAYDATDLSKELYDSNQNAARDGLGSYVKFQVLTVANGEVFAGTQDSLVIYGLNPTAPTGTPTVTPTPGAAYNNVGITDDTNTVPGNFDGTGDSYSEQALRSNGINPGDNAFYGHTVFAWPNVSPGAAENYVVSGQTIPVTPLTNATVVAFAGAATGGASSGTVTINYTDGTAQFVTLGFSDWRLNGGLSFGNGEMSVMPYYNTPTGQANTNSYLLYADKPLTVGKTLKSVTLPTSTTGGTMHVFAVTTNQGPPPAAVYNNIATSNDNNPSAGNFDGTNSYSAQSLQTLGITPGSTLTFNGVNFTWPNVAAGLKNNYVTKGQLLSISPVNGATTLAFLGAATGGSASGTATLNYSDGSTQDFQLGMSDWTLGGNNNPPSFGNQVVATTTYRNTPKGPQTTSKPVILYTDVALQAGKTLQSVILPSVISGGQIHIFTAATKGGTVVTPTPTSTPIPTPTSTVTVPTPTPTSTVPTPTPTPPSVPYNNIATSDDSAPSTGNFDGTNSYSTQALQTVGITPGGTVAFNGVTFTWPGSAAGTFNDYLANGQTLAVTPVNGATTLAFLGAATGGKTSGTATINYSDGSTQTFTLGFSDWTLGGAGTDAPSFGNLIVTKTAYRNTPAGQQTSSQPAVFYTDVTLQAGAGVTVKSVTLPTTVTGGWLHVFTVGIKAVAGGGTPTPTPVTPPAYTNTGVSDDTNRSPGNFDGTNSYSAEALQAVGITPGGVINFNGVNFTWPGSPVGMPDDYIAQGNVLQVTPVTGATTLAFLGSSSNGSGSGTATITYSDGSTQTFTLGFSDWTLGGAGTDAPSFGNQVVATTAYRNTPAGSDTHKPVLFYADVALQTTGGKTITSVTLPSTSTGGQLHIFAVATK